MNVCPDVPLRITFSSVPVVGEGKIEVVDNSTNAVVATIDVAAGVKTKAIGGLANFNYYPVEVHENEVTVDLADQSLAYGKAYRIQVDTEAFHDSNGRSFLGSSSSEAWHFTTKPAPPAKDSPRIVVAADCSGDFATIQGAIDFVPEGNTVPRTIFVRRGIYREIVALVGKHRLTIVGEDRKQSIIAYPNNERFNHNVGGNPPARGSAPGRTPTIGVGVYRRGMFLAHRTSDLVMVNLTLHNTTPQGGSQAEALILNGDLQAHAMLLNVDLLSFQDTLQINGQAYIRNCYIEGDVDFLWGKGPCFFENCEARSMRSKAYYTQIRNPSTNHGYVFTDCLFSGASGVTENVLSRIAPGRFPASEVVLLGCRLTDAVSNVGWRLDQATEAPSVHFWEYDSRLPSGERIDTSRRLSAAKQLSQPVDQELIDHYSDPRYVLGGDWTPRLAPIITTQPTSISFAAGQKATVSCGAVGIPVPSVQWRKNQHEIAGATNTTLTIERVTEQDAGVYTAIFTNTVGTIDSAPAKLTIAH